MWICERVYGCGANGNGGEGCAMIMIVSVLLLITFTLYFRKCYLKRLKYETSCNKQVVVFVVQACWGDKCCLG